MSLRNRRPLFILALIAIVFLVIEAAAHVLYFARYGGPYTRSGLVRHLAAGTEPRDELGAGGVMAEIAQRRILHPFFGYAMDQPSTMGAGGDVHPLQQRTGDRFVVAVAGGSVANQVRSVLADALHESFAERGIDREPVVVGLAIDGFKQPQQLTSVAYFLSLGAAYDAVVNIDGFNDIVLPIVDNHRRGVSPYYPRSWNSFVNRRPSQTTLLGAGEISFLRQQQRQRLTSARRSVLDLSAIAGLVHASQLDHSTRRIGELQRSLLEEAGDLSFEASGPTEKVDDIAQVYQRSAAIWAEGSILLHQLLQARGTTYIHVLQPNQYVEGSRNLTETEREKAFDLDHPYAAVAARGYPYLFESADALRAAGIAYFDATPIFAEIPEPIYSDTCCHVNRRGKTLFARRVADFLLDEVERREPAER